MLLWMERTGGELREEGQAGSKSRVTESGKLRIVGRAGAELKEAAPVFLDCADIGQRSNQTLRCRFGQFRPPAQLGARDRFFRMAKRLENPEGLDDRLAAFGRASRVHAGRAFSCS